MVNGKLDDEIAKLNEISEKEAKNAYETATANYNNAKKATDNATGDDSYLFVDGYAYTGKREKDAENVLKQAGFGGNIATGAFKTKLFVLDSYDNSGKSPKELTGAQEKADYLQSMIDVLEQNGQRATDLYAGLISQRDKYLEYIDNQQEAANSLINSWISYSQYSDDELSKININSIDSFEEYRQKMINEAKNDESIGQMLADGTLSDEDLEKAIDDFMATSTKFSTWYQQWINSVQNASTSKDARTVDTYQKTINRFPTNKAITQQDVTDATAAVQEEYDKIHDWGLDSYADQIKNGTIQSKYGNVDMDNRQIINWNLNNIEKWKDQLSDIKYYDDDGNFIDSYYDQLKESVEKGESNIDTVFGDMIDHIEGYDGISSLAFSHVVDNDDGTFEFLGQKTAEEYIYGILDEAKKDGDLSIDHILELDKQGDKNAEIYDAQGKKIGQSYIHGIIAGFNSDSDDVSKLLHMSGKYGGVQIAQRNQRKVDSQYGNNEQDKIKNFLDENGISDNQELLDEFNQVTEGITNADAAILQWKIHQEQAAESFSTAWNDLKTLSESSDDSTDKEDKAAKALYKSLTDLADKGELTVDTFRKVDGAENYFDSLGISAGQAVNQINQLSDKNSQVSAMRKNIQSMSEALYSKQTDGFATAEDFAGFDATIKGLDTWQEFTTLLGDAKSSMEDCQTVANKLATEYVNNNEVICQLDDSTAEYFRTQMTSMGVSNADAVVQDRLNYLHAKQAEGLQECIDAGLQYNDQKITSSNYSDMLASATANEVGSLANEAIQSGNSADALATLAVKKAMANGTTLSTAGDIQNLADLANVGTEVGKLLNRLAQLKKGFTNGEPSEAIEKETESITSRIMAMIGGGGKTNVTVIPQATTNNKKSGGTDKTSGSSTKKKTPLEKLQDWLSTLFDWIEIKLERQTDKISKYISKAESQLDDKKYSSSANNYSNAIDATNVQVGYEETARDKYYTQASKILDKAVAGEVISQKTADIIATRVADGSMDISEYSDEIQDVISAYQEWYNKGKDASDALEELHKNIRTYIQDLKDVRDKQRDAKIDSITGYNDIATSTVANSARAKNSQLNASNSSLGKQNSVYRGYVQNVTRDTNGVAASANGSVTNAIKGTKDAKYRTALLNAQKAIKNKTAVSDADLSTISAHSTYVYNRLYAYNVALDNAETARMEYATAYSSNYADAMKNIAEKYSNKDDETNDRIDVYGSKASNYSKASTKNHYIKKQIASYDMIGKDNKSEIKRYKAGVISSRKLMSKVATATAYNALSDKGRKVVDDVVAKARSVAKSGKTISASLISTIAEFYDKGYISRPFFEACIRYNTDREQLEQARKQKTTDEQSAYEAIMGYVSDLEQAITEARDNSLSKIQDKESAVIGGVSNTVESQNSNLKYQNSILKQKNKIYKKATKNAGSMVSSYGNIALSELKKSKSKNKKYKQILAKAKSAIKKRVRVPNNLVKTIANHNPTLYRKIKAYNEWVDNVETARNEQDVAYATNNAQKYTNIADIYNNRDDKTNDEISLNGQKSDNAVSAKTKNSYLNKQASGYSTIVNRDKAEVSTYQKAIKGAKAGINKSAKGSKYSTLSKKGKENVHKLAASIRATAKSGKRISDKTMAKLYTWAAKGYIKQSFLNSCIDYNNAWDSRKQAKDQLEIDKQTEKAQKTDIAQQKFSNVQTEMDNKRQKYEQASTELNDMMNLYEERGNGASATWYKRMKSVEQKNYDGLVAERKSLVKQLESSVADGSIKKGSDEWYKMQSSIDEVTNSINASKTALAQYDNQILQVHWDRVDDYVSKLQNLTSETDFVINELSRKDLTSDKKGGLTKEGKAVAGLHVSNYKVYQTEAKKYQSEIEKINKQLADNPYNQKLISHKEELVKSYQDAVAGAQDEKWAVLDLIENGYNALSNKIKNLISDYEDLLSSQKNTYDYANNISEKTEQLANIRKQLQAYSGDLSEESRAKVQELNVSLKDAQKDLKDTQFDQYISATQDMLSDFQDDLDENIQNIIDTLDTKFKDIVDTINENWSSDNNIITKTLSTIGYSATKDGLRIYANGDITKNTTDAIKTLQNFLVESWNVFDTEAKDAKTSDKSDKINQLQKDNESLAKKITALSKEIDALKSKKKDTGSDKNNNTKNQINTLKNELSTAQKEKKQLEKKLEEATKTTDVVISAKLDPVKKTQSTTKSSSSGSKTTSNKSTSKTNTTATTGKKLSDTKKKEVQNFINTHLMNPPKGKKKSDYDAFNQNIWTKYGTKDQGKIMSKDNLYALAKLVGYDFSNKSTSPFWQTLHKSGIKGFRRGSESIPYDMIANLGEDGTELQYDVSKGVLKSVGQNDMIFTAEQAKTLMDFAKNPMMFSNMYTGNAFRMPNMPVTNRTDNDINITIGDVNLEGVQNPQQFASSMKDVIKNNTGGVRNMLKDTTVGSLSSNHNSLGIRKY